MVKRLLIAILVCFMLSIPRPVMAETGQLKKIHSMEVINPNVEFSKYKLIDNTAYLKITDINGFTAVNIWEEAFLLKKSKIKKLVVYINSTGGDVLNSHAIVDIINDLKKSGIKVVTEAHGMVASAAVPIFLSGSKRITTRNTVFLMHPLKNESYGFTSDSIRDLKAKENIMSILKGIYVSIVHANSNLSSEKISSLVDEDSWFTAEQAEKWGMIDELR